MIEVVDVWKNFEENEVLKGLTLTIKTAETIVILGRSGVGKSVLLKHIIGITKPDRGVINVDGVDVTKLSGEALSQVTMNMGMLFQGSALFDSMNVEDNIAFYLNQHGDPLTKKRYPYKEVKERVDQALEIVGLQGVQKKMPSDLSGGMKKRAALARLIVYRPTYLLYDEPTTGLDPITAMQINELIVKTQQELKSTSIVVTHDIISALFVADRLALHKEGKIAYVANPDDFLKIDDPIIDFLRKTISQDPRTFRQRDYAEPS